MEANLGQTLPTVVQKLELAQPEPKKPVSGETIRLSDALQLPKIVNGNRDDLIKSLRYAMMKIGLREQNWPSKEETALLLQHIEKNYGGHTVAEIRLAFDLAISGQIGVEANCYENFSCLYFSNIMSAYREWAKEEHKQIQAKHIIALPEIKEDMSQEAMQDWFNDVAKKIKAGQLRVEYVPEMLYEWMDNNGNISATATQKYEYLNRAVEYRLGVLREALEKDDSATNRFALSSFVTMRNNGCLEGAEIGIVKTLAKKILLFEMIINYESNGE